VFFLKGKISNINNNNNNNINDVLLRFIFNIFFFEFKMIV
jgi:hypothetical protein